MKYLILLVLIVLIGCTDSVSEENFSPEHAADLEICVNDNGFVNHNCIANIARTNNEPALCDEIKDMPRERDSCVSYIATGTNNLELCEEAGSWRNTCVAVIARETVTPELCETIELQFDKDTCWSGVAKASLDPEFCENIQEVDTPERTRFLKASCFAFLGKKLSDENLCVKAGTWVIANNCIETVAKEKEDPSICDLLLVRTDSTHQSDIYGCKNKVKNP